MIYFLLLFNSIIFCLFWLRAIRSLIYPVNISDKFKKPNRVGKKNKLSRKIVFYAVFRIRIRIHLFFGLLDPDPLVRGMDPDSALDSDPDPSIIMQK
jgi:hypothetical protein